MNNRFINGFSFSNPSTGHPILRESRVSFGYVKDLLIRLTLDIIFEKKSFYFDKGGLPGLNRKIRAGVVEFTYHW